ncbi:MAG: ExeM/NucH family extracellular endonuclease [Ilumatobacter sp.]|nr:ExeM/NucH family extracellular endonuclease [Ilumatobacter sp.]
MRSLPRSVFALASLGLLTTGVVLPAATATADVAVESLLINEIRMDQSGADDDEYVELIGTPDAPLDGYTYLVIGDGTGGSGVIENVTPLDGQVLGSDGLFVAAESTFTLATADMTTSLNFENSDNVTHLLVSGFTGADGDDLDTDDDGALDTMPWTSIVDSVALIEDAPAGELVYSPTIVGPDGVFVPGHVYRCGDDWSIGAFEPVGEDDTPGAANGCLRPVLINEVDADTPGTDAAEFVELYADPDTPLDGYTVVFYNGYDDTLYAAFDLDTYSTDSNGYFVLGNADVAGDHPPFPDNLLQNGADAVALYADDAANLPYGMTITTTNLVDAVVYDTADGDDAGLLTLLEAGQPQLDEGANGDKDNHSNQRCPDGSGNPRETSTFVAAPATPGTANCQAAATVADLLLTEVVVAPTAGEYVEILNTSSGTLDLSDVYLTDATFAGGDFYYNIVTGTNAGGGGFGDFHARFPDGASIGPGEYQTVAMTGSDDFFLTYGLDPTYELFEDGIADAVPDMREAFTDSINNQGGLTNDGELVVLYTWDGVSDLVGDIDYVLWGDTVEAVDKTGITIDGPDADTDTSTYLADTAIASQDVVSSGGHDAGASFQRDDLTEGTEVQTGGNGVGGSDETSEDLSTTWCIAAPTPNAASVCVPPPPVTTALISEVQGSGSDVAITTPVEITAIVTSLFEDDDAVEGVFVQEEDDDADADPSTSEGIYVFCNTNCPPALAVGDQVTVTGTPSEFQGMSEITASGAGDVVIDSSGNDLPTATSVDLPAGSYLDATTFESLEAMLVTFPDTLVVSEYFELARFGQLILTADSRPFQFTHDNAPDAGGYAAHLASLETRQLILDDDNNDQNDAITGGDEPYSWPVGGLSTTNTFRGGETITDLVGVLDWSYPGFGDTTWRLRPVDGVDYTFDPANPRTATPDDVGGDVTVASFNVLNYFADVDNGFDDICGPTGDKECRGADNEDERSRQLEKIASAMAAMDADVIGLIEVQNDTGAATQQIVEAVNAIVGAGTYDFVDTGFIGTDAIKVGLLYRTTTVSLTGSFAVLDSSVDPDFDDGKNRPALVQTFTEAASGERFTVAVNHLKSKGSPCDDVADPDLLDGQGNCNLTRTAAAQALADFLAADPTGSGDDDVLIIGDLNSYAMEDPITTLEAAGYTDLLEAEYGTDVYSYTFDSQVGYLDHALANAALAPAVTGATVWHINADEPVEFDYNDAVLDDGEQSYERESSALTIYANDPYRSSDHDPVLVGLVLTDPPTVDLAPATGQDDPTNKTPIVLTATFDQTVDGFDADDVVIGGAAVPSTAEVTDLGSGVFEISVSGMTGSGDVTVSVRADAVTNSGGQQSLASATVTIDYDVTAPTLTVPSAVSATAAPGESGAVVTFVVSADDPEVPSGTLAEVVLDPSAIECTPASGSFFEIGDTTVTCTATDDAGNIATESFVVTVTDDEAPVLADPADQTIVVESGSSSVVTYDLPVVSDNSGDVDVVCEPPSGSTFPVGTTTVTCTATDGSGNTATTTFDIVVQSNAVTTTTTPTTIAPELPATGSSPFGALRWAALLLAGGVVLIVGAARRRGATVTD